MTAFASSLSRFLVLLFIFPSLLGGLMAKACKCAAPDLSTKYNDASVSDVMRVKILSGSVSKNFKDGSRLNRVYAAVVIQTYKGTASKGDFIILNSNTDSASCGTKLKVKSTMLVTASSAGQSPGNFKVDSCGYTKKWKEVKSNRRDKDFLGSLPGCCLDREGNPVCDASVCSCSDGKKPVNCFADPCEVSECNEGSCTPNYCGGCNANWNTDSGASVCTKCNNDGDCNKDIQKCVDNQCRTLCYGNASCSEGHFCDQDKGICEREKHSFMYYKTCGLPVCTFPAPDTGLPECQVKEGSICEASDAGEQCDPGTGCGVKLMCTDSDPTLGGRGCPRSRRATKRDINYLDEVSRRTVADDLLNIRLAEWNYKQDPEETEPRLGFIIEDLEPSPAVDSKRDMVDLYGYLSMAVAAIQTQQEQITKLQGIVEELRQ